MCQSCDASAREFEILVLRRVTTESVLTKLTQLQKDIRISGYEQTAAELGSLIYQLAQRHADASLSVECEVCGHHYCMSWPNHLDVKRQQLCSGHNRETLIDPATGRG